MREWVEAFVERLNRAPFYALLLQEQAHMRDPTHYADPKQGTPIPEDKRYPGAVDLAQVTSIVRGLIGALERGDKVEIERALKPAQEYLSRVLVQPSLRFEEGELKVVYEDKTEGREFFATALLLDFLVYLQHYADDVKLGICRHCGKVFVKPKHGAQAVYCSNACKQRAYRERKGADKKGVEKDATAREGKIHRGTGKGRKARD